jgi:hypothetical protein
VTLPTGRRLYVAGGVAVVVVVMAVMAMREEEPAPAAPGRAARTSSRAPQGVVPVDDVRLELLKDRQLELPDAERNPFRFRPRPAPAPPARAAAPAERPAPIAPPVPMGPPPPPPIPLRYIGLMDAPTQALRVAVLSDGRGNVFYGKEGDIIEGRYRVVRISADAAELMHVDGRGRQTIRLSGQ